MSPSKQIVGAFVFPDFWADLSRASSILTRLRDCGVNAIMTEAERYELPALRATHKVGLRFYAGIACFSDHASDFRSLKERPELWPVIETGERRAQMEWYIGMSPTNRRRQEEAFGQIKSIARAFPIDGFFLDFARWPLHWEIELRPRRSRPPDSSFDPVTLAKFEEFAGPLPRSPRAASAQAAWIHENRYEEWVDFKCKVVRDFAAEAAQVLKEARINAELGIYVVPDVNGLTEALTGQRIKDLAPTVDWIAPMVYHNILLQRPGWIGSALASVVKFAGQKTLPVLQADSNRDQAGAGDWGPPMQDSDWREALSEVAGRPDIGGFIIFPGAAMIGPRGDSLRAMLGAGQ